MNTPHATCIPTEQRLRILLGMACAYALHDRWGATRLFLLATKTHWIDGVRISNADCRVATAGVWLIKELALHPEPVSVVLKRGNDAGYTRRELERAARLLHVVRSKRVGCGMWVWMLTSSRTCKYYRKIGLHMFKAVKARKAPKAPKTLDAALNASKAAKAPKALKCNLWISDLN